MNQLQCNSIFHSLPPKLTSEDVVAIDLELSGLREDQLHRPYGHLASLACCSDGKNVYIVFDESDVQEFLGRISEATWIFHNAIFDLGHLRRWATISDRKNMRDTMLIEKIMWSDYYDDFGLNDLVRRYLRAYLPKDVRKEFQELAGPMTREQIEYAALDVVGTWMVDKEQQKILSEQDGKIWKAIDRPTVWTALSLSGFGLDTELWGLLADKNEEIVQRIEIELGQTYGHIEPITSGRGKNKVTSDVFIPFNPASPSQVLSVLHSIGINVSSTGDDELRPYIENWFVESILEYRTAAKRASTYGRSYLKFVEN